MHVVAVAPFIIDIGRSLREAFFMFWETLWALVLGFTLSGFVQAFVSKRTMQQQLGTRSPKAIARATGYGMVSSSCSYAASSMSKSLFKKGADFVTSMVFMLASTNLVIELGLILLVLLGWQFALAEFVGGPIMIILLALFGGVVLTGSLIQTARRRVQSREGDHDQGAPVSQEREDELEDTPFKVKVNSPAAWSDAASYAVADATMLRKELFIGYLVAGFLATLVPTSLWNALFLHGHGFWTVLENALVGPLIAIASWVCSIGNVPLAAALWAGGISFGGVIAFIFADLIAMPLILIYAKFYGWKLTVRLFALFYVVMVLGGLATEGIFHLAGAIPTHRTVTVAPTHFQWNYTSYLNIIFLLLAGAVWLLARNRTRFGGGQGYAIDPVCSMQVRTADAPAHTQFDGHDYFFCSDRCATRFIAEPEAFLMGDHGKGIEDSNSAIDPMCGMNVAISTESIHRHYEGSDFYFCGEGCAERFDEDPASHLAS